MERFDRHDWHPELCKNTKDIERFLDRHDIKKKSISDIHGIGVAIEEGPWRWLRRADNSMEDTYDWEKEEPAKVELMMPQKLEICEPLIIEFSDGTTLELKPENMEGMFMSVNQIRADLKDGVNNHNFEQSEFFGCLKGWYIDKAVRYNEYEKGYPWKSMMLKLILKDDHNNLGWDLFVVQEYNGWFKVSVVNHHDKYSAYEDCISRIPHDRLKAVAKNWKQVEIVEGHDSGGYFWIMPVKLSKKTDRGVEEYREEEISIDEMDVSGFLYFFLEKYFDASFPYDEIDPYREKGFVWNLEYNIYSYETTRIMLDDIEKCADYLENDYDNPRISDLVNGYNWVFFSGRSECNDKRDYNTDPLTEEEQKKVVRDNIRFAIEFYRRFVWRMRLILDHSPDYDLISFMGP